MKQWSAAQMLVLRAAAFHSEARGKDESRARAQPDRERESPGRDEAILVYRVHDCGTDRDLLRGLLVIAAGARATQRVEVRRGRAPAVRATAALSRATARDAAGSPR